MVQFEAMWRRVMQELEMGVCQWRPVIQGRAPEFLPPRNQIYINMWGGLPVLHVDLALISVAHQLQTMSIYIYH